MDEEERPLDFTKLKYVLYARKSRTDEAAQVRSIPDQIDDCLKLARDLGLNVVKVLEEAKSAKIPRQREVFKQMIIDVKKGIYDGIIAWNPDRLARNMLEGGEIIDLIDQDIIKDLKFKTHHFTKDANGKMLLGMAFVLSKQYSDDLSQKVTRGVRHRFKEGKTPTPKHGYVNENGIYKPDGKNHELICNAWKLRLEGQSLEEITTYLNENGYSRIIKKTGRAVDMDTRILTDLFKDSFYYGVLIQAKQTVDLRELYEFVPAVEERDFFAVQELSYRRIKPSKPHRATFYPLRLMVHCSFCSQSMRVGPSTGSSGQRYLNYRCDNKSCTRKKKSIRAKFVFNFIYDLLANGLNLTEQEYRQYLKHIVKITDDKREEIRGSLHNKQGLLRHVNTQIRDISLKIVNYERDSTVWKINTDRIIELEGEKSQLTQDIAKLEEKLVNPEADQLSVEEFLNLSKNAATIVQSADVVKKDIICRLMFLNFTVDEKKVVSYQAKEPFATLIKHRQQRTSRGDMN